MSGDLVTPEYFSPECTALHRPKCCEEDVAGSWFHYFLNGEHKKFYSDPQFRALLEPVAPTSTLAEDNPQRTKAMAPK